MRTRTLAFLLALTATGCDMVEVYQRQIDRATRAIENAKSDAETALAVQDHDRAVELAPGDARVYYERGRSDYDRGAQIDGIDADRRPWMDAARRDFTAAVERDPRDAVSYDFLGLVEEQTGRIDEAVAAYTRVMELDPHLGRLRLAELHCTRGQAHVKEEKFDLAAAELEKSVALDVAADGCSCEPYNALAYVYIDATGQYDKGRDLVRRAQASGHVIAPEYIERLEKAGKGV